ncbi:MAG: hypothetical protein Q9217_002091 [Psora testacea]
MERIKTLFNYGIDLATNPKHTTWLSYLLLVLDGLLTSLVVNKTRSLLKTMEFTDTEIDWVAYMQQIALYRSGERDYANIKGQTGTGSLDQKITAGLIIIGPLVYPAGHVMLYDALYRLTDEGSNIFRAQCIFMIVYLAALSVVMACYRKANAPPYLLALLILSKRVHSIFVLRLFNDCFAVLGLFSAIYFYQAGMFAFGSLAFSFAVSVKMSILLAAPGVGIALLQALPPKRVINSVMLMAQVQILLAVPFITVNARSYIGRAFQLTRQFVFKWTVNWRFIGEDTFLSPGFAILLLLTNVTLLTVFVFTRWTRPSSLSPSGLARTMFKPLPPRMQQQMLINVTPDFILTSTVTSLIIGLLSARTLHYQFYAYIAWSTPFLLWKTNMPSYIIILIWVVQEWAWNVYPSTDVSSMVVMGCLAIQVIGVWWGTRNDFADETILMKGSEDEHQHVD